MFLIFNDKCPQTQARRTQAALQHSRWATWEAVDLIVFEAHDLEPNEIGVPNQSVTIIQSVRKVLQFFRA
jgi:hypothetical protein